MADSTQPSPVAGSMPAGCGGSWPRCHWPQLLDRSAGRSAPGARGRHRHRHRPATARTGRDPDQGRSMAGRRPEDPHHRGRRLRRTPSRVPAEGPAGAGAGPDALGPRRAAGRPAPAASHPGAGRPGTAASSSSASATPGAPRTPRLSPTHVFTAPPEPAPGTGCTPGSPTALPGQSPTALSRSSRGR
jgi:hypothetical protein